MITKIRKNIKLQRVTIPNIIIEHSEYLKAGVYKLKVNRSILAYSDKKELEIIGKNWNLHKESILKCILKKSFACLLSKNTKVEPGKKIFQGSLIKFHYSYNYLRIFDIDKMELMHTFENEDEKNKIVENKKILSNYFPVPKSVIYDSNIFVEKIILDDLHDMEKKLDLINEFYLGYFRQLKDDKLFLNKDTGEYIRDFLIDEYSTELFNIIDLKTFKELSVVLLHGDCWSANVISNSNSLYFIDYETVGNYYFLYDFFKYLFGEFTFKEEGRLLDKYFKGSYDIYLDKAFKIFELSFEKDERPTYLILFFIIYYHKKCKDKDESHRDFYKNQINKILSIYN